MKPKTTGNPTLQEIQRDMKSNKTRNPTRQKIQPDTKSCWIRSSWKQQFLHAKVSSPIEENRSRRQLTVLSRIRRIRTVVDVVVVLCRDQVSSVERVRIVTSFDSCFFCFRRHIAFPRIRLHLRHFKETIARDTVIRTKRKLSAYLDFFGKMSVETAEFGLRRVYISTFVDENYELL